MQYSVITPTAGKRPASLNRAIKSVGLAMEQAGLTEKDVEMLVGYDGVKGLRPEPCPDFARLFHLPLDNDWGNGIRPILLRAAKGRRVLFVDDDNQLTPEAFSIYQRHPEAELVIARVDTSRAFKQPHLPMEKPGASLVRQGNVDPLCICASRELVVDRCGNWQFSGYPADYQNILNFHRRAASVVVTEEVVGIYDAGRGLDQEGHADRRRLPHEIEGG